MDGRMMRFYIFSTVFWSYPEDEVDNERLLQWNSFYGRDFASSRDQTPLDQ